MLIIKRAASERELQDVHALRYAVYCLERGYEPPDDYPAKVEVDGYDPYSVHFIAYAPALRDVVVPAGTVRLILPNPLGFPVERYCRVQVRNRCNETAGVAEISRLAVSAEATARLRIVKSEVTFGLIRELYHTLRELNIERVFTAMTTGLERLLRACGLSFTAAGPSVAYHGIRTPFYAEVDTLFKGAAMSRRGALQLLCRPREEFYTSVNRTDSIACSGSAAHRAPYS
ncbi:MAG: GNAT family N-acyltransferase [Nitrospirota bacterium]